MLHEATTAILLIKILFSTITTLFTISFFLDFRYSKSWTVLTFAIFMAYVFSTSWFLLESFSWVMFVRVIIFFIYIPVIILFYVLTEDGFAKQLFICITQINLLIIIWLAAKLFNTLFGNKPNGDLIVSIFLFCEFAILEYFYVRKYRKKNSNTLDYNWGLMAPIPIAFFMLLWIMLMFKGETKITFWHAICLLFVVILMLAVYAALFISLVENYRRLKIKMQNSVMVAQLDAQERNYMIFLEKERKIYRMKKQAEEASELLWQGNLVRAADILMDIAEANESGNMRVYCTNFRINDIVSRYALMCSENNVRFACDMKFDRRKLPIPEICFILGGGLENAFEASMKLPMEQRFIKLQARIVQEQFLIRIRNRFGGRLQFSGDLPHTEKKMEGHGYGFSSIQAAAIRAKGEIVFRVEEDNFVLDVRVQAKPIHNN